VSGGEQFAELPVGLVIEIVQIYRDTLLKVPLEKSLSIFFRAINQQWLHFAFPS
jgi:hypothetical protein